MKNKRNTGRLNKSIFGGLAIVMMVVLSQSNCLARDLYITAKPGGTYNLPAVLNDTKIVIDGYGSSESPFTVTGVAGKTTINGNSAILVVGNYITVQNVSFINNNINYRESEALLQLGDKKRAVLGDAIRNCDFNYTNVFDDQDKATQFYWVEIYGRNNVVDYCTFQGKQNRLPIIHVNSHSWTGEDNTISNCTFQNVKARKGEALEAIRVGLGDSRSNCRIINNKFMNYFGDSETVSCKSNGVLIEGNTFTNCRSGVSLRLSDSSVIKNNKFMTKAGVRISGIGHVITNNVFDSPDFSSIIFMRGGDACNYKRVNGVDISDNIFMGKFEMQVLKTKNCPSPPEGVTIHHNFVYADNLFKVDDDNIDNVFKTDSEGTVIRTDGIGVTRFRLKRLNSTNEDSAMRKVRAYRAQKQNN